MARHPVVQSIIDDVNQQFLGQRLLHGGATVWAEEFNRTLVKLGHQEIDEPFLWQWFHAALMRTGG